MRKNIFGRQLKRDANERKALFKSLASSLVLKERITTTETKAKAVKGFVEELVTAVKKRGKKNSLALYLTQPAIEKLATSIAPRFFGRAGGYTRIVRTKKRVSDNAQMVLLEWVEGAKQVESAGLEVQSSGEETTKK